MTTKPSRFFAIAGICALLVVALAVQITFLDQPEHLDANAEPAAWSSAHLAGTGRVAAPLPDRIVYRGPQVVLGEALFRDTRLSADGSLSCVSCHDVASGGDDGLPIATAIAGTRADFNTPTVLNSRHNLLHFWRGEGDGDGSATTILEHGGRLMGSSPMLMSLRLEQDVELLRRFNAAFPDGLTEATIAAALEAYLATLDTPDSPFDRYLQGERDALTIRERQGFRLFREIGCAACHQGRNLGGNMVQRLGIFEDYFSDGDGHDQADLGRQSLTGREEDRHVFRVPSLRNVARTAPYFHDGSIADLRIAVRIMARYQLGRRLSEEDSERLVAFLETLSAEPARQVR